MRKFFSSGPNIRNCAIKIILLESPGGRKGEKGKRGRGGRGRKGEKGGGREVGESRRKGQREKEKEHGFEIAPRRGDVSTQNIIIQASGGEKGSETRINNNGNNDNNNNNNNKENLQSGERGKRRESWGD